MMGKVCKVCHIFKDLTDFHIDKKSKDLHSNRCKSCANLLSRRWYSDNKDRARKYKQDRRDHIKIVSKAYREAHKDIAKKAFKLWVSNNLEQRKIYMHNYFQSWYAHNSDRHKKNSKLWNLSHLEHVRERRRLYAQSHREQINAGARMRYAIHPENSSKWRKANWDKVKEKYMIYNENRRCRLVGHITYKEWKDLCCKFDNACLCCGSTTKSLTMDHIVPISMGGLNIIDNIQPLCRSCNAKKHTRTIDYRNYKD